MVLDLETLSPLGTLPADVIYTLDTTAGRLYARRGGTLLVFSEQGGQFKPPPPGDPSPLLSEGISSIHVSPAYADDDTLFASTGGKVFRSTNGGQTWAQLHGGLPTYQRLGLDLRISPNFANDRTLFLFFGGYRDSYQQCHGVYRSTDGGDTWQGMWNGLSHLCVRNVILSPSYADDGTLLAYAEYTNLLLDSRSSKMNGKSVFRSTDRGLSWTQVVTNPGNQASWPSPEDLLPPEPSPPVIYFRFTKYEEWVLERTTDGGRTWQTINAIRQRFSPPKILISPNLAADYTIYIRFDQDLYRSTDIGETWERWPGEQADETKPAALAISPLLRDGSYRLFVYLQDGQVRALDPMTLAWEPVPIAPQWPTVLEGETIFEIDAGPDGDVWLNTSNSDPETWKSGLVHYANGTIQARYTLTDGLPGPYASSVAVAPDNTPWIAISRTVASFDGQRWTMIDLPNPAYRIEAGPDGTVWARDTKMSSILRWDGQTWETTIAPEEQNDFRVYDMTVAPDGILWCATSGGLAQHSGGTWSMVNANEVVSVASGPDGTIYFRSGRKFWRYAGNELTELPSHGIRGGLKRLYAAKDGALWLGTSVDGTFRYNGHNWRQFTAQDGLPSNQVYAIAEDADGWLWFGTRNGAARVDPTTLNLSPVN